MVWSFLAYHKRMCIFRNCFCTISGEIPGIQRLHQVIISEIHNISALPSKDATFSFSVTPVINRSYTVGSHFDWIFCPILCLSLPQNQLPSMVSVFTFVQYCTLCLFTYKKMVMFLFWHPNYLSSSQLLTEYYLISSHFPVQIFVLILSVIWEGTTMCTVFSFQHLLKYFVHFNNIFDMQILYSILKCNIINRCEPTISQVEIPLTPLIRHHLSISE